MSSIRTALTAVKLIRDAVQADGQVVITAEGVFIAENCDQTIIEALERQMPKEPVVSSNDKEVPKTHRLGRLLQYHCPTCNNRILVRYETDTPERGYTVSIHYQNCSRCGQRIDFGELYRKIPGDEELELED